MFAKTKPDDFMTIKGYKYKFGNICERPGVCMGRDDAQMNAKIEEAFYTGLSKRKKLEMSRLNIRIIIGIYKIIHCPEETLKKQINLDETNLKIKPT